MNKRWPLIALPIIGVSALSFPVAAQAKTVPSIIHVHRNIVGTAYEPSDPLEQDVMEAFPQTFVTTLDANGWQQFFQYLQVPYAYDQSEASMVLSFEAIQAYFASNPNQMVPPFSTDNNASSNQSDNDSGASSANSSGLTTPLVTNSTSGVSEGAINDPTGTPETWYTSNDPSSIQMNTLNSNTDSNVIPIEGSINDPDFQGGDIVVEVIPVNSAGQEVGNNFWVYSMPTSNGQFSANITLPYQGYDEVEVGLQDPTQSSFSLQSDVVYGVFQNNQPSLTETQMGLLQSWMVNYNESTSFSTLANSITASASTTDEKIEDISNWVSSNIAYNWPASNSGNIPWQQATDTLQSKLGVCQDEASVTAALLRSIGIPAETVQGTLDINGQQEGSHEWLRVYDGTSWINVDPTLDQIYYQGTTASLPSQIDDTYFDMPNQIFDQTHIESSSEDW